MMECYCEGRMKAKHKVTWIVKEMWVKYLH